MLHFRFQRRRRRRRTVTSVVALERSTSGCSVAVRVVAQWRQWLTAALERSTSGCSVAVGVVAQWRQWLPVVANRSLDEWLKPVNDSSDFRLLFPAFWNNKNDDRLTLSLDTLWLCLKQEAQLSQRDRAMLRSLNISLCRSSHSRSFEW